MVRRRTEQNDNVKSECVSWHRSGENPVDPPSDTSHSDYVLWEFFWFFLFCYQNDTVQVQGVLGKKKKIAPAAHDDTLRENSH